MQVLIDADNVAPGRVQPVLDLIADRDDVTVVASGRGDALARLRLPATAEQHPVSGWQRADVALAMAYRAADAPLVLVSGDGDFALLAGRHPGPVLVISGAPSGRLRDTTMIVDPAVDGLEPVRQWLDAQDQRSSGRRPPV